MWVAGMSFGYGVVRKVSKKASIIRLAGGEGDWYEQFRAVMLLRISPFLYALYNYCAVVTDVKFVPYLFGTLVGMVPEIFVAIYTRIRIRMLADASKDQRSLSVLQVVLTVGGFLLTIATTVTEIYMSIEGDLNNAKRRGMRCGRIFVRMELLV
ncbi:hypothetical protein L2E82_50319 [Cichorium intybus]|nr:hypothetical protein L2E82_50319 [Cichorium intybus]